MARPTGSKVIACPQKKCKGKIVAEIGSSGTCKYCGTKVRFTKKLMRELGKKI
jgi:hypothetical protein